MVLLLTSLHGNDSADGVLVLSTDLSHRDCLLTSILFFFFSGMRQVFSAKRRHQSTDWMILSHVDCFIQGEVIGYQVLLDFIHVVRGRSGGLLQFSEGEAVKIFLTSVSSGVRAVLTSRAV